MKNLIFATQALEQSTELRKLQGTYMRARDFKETVVNNHLTRRAEQIGAEADFLSALSEGFERLHEQENLEEWDEE